MAWCDPLIVGNVIQILWVGAFVAAFFLIVDIVQWFIAVARDADKEEP